jgi:hypothetical protein
MALAHGFQLDGAVPFALAKRRGKVAVAPKLGAVALAMLVGLLSACGDGGDAAPATQPPAQPPAPVAAQINGSNYLDAFALTFVGAHRMEFVAYLIDSAFQVVIDSDGVAGTYRCDVGGLITLQTNGSSRTLTPNNCDDGSYLLVSGSISSANATASQFGGLIVLDAGDFVLSNALYGDVIDTEAADGTVRLQRGPALGFTAVGQLSVLRNGRIDQYVNVSVTTAPIISDTLGRLTGGSMSISSPRFAAQPLAISVSGAANSISATAPDGSRVVATIVSSGTPAAYRFDVYAVDSSTPVTTQTLALNDPSVLEAIWRTLD